VFGSTVAREKPHKKHGKLAAGRSYFKVNGKINRVEFSVPQHQAHSETFEH